MNIESVFLEVKRVLAPGGVFLFTEEPLRRLLSLRIYRIPYQDRMKPWERKLFDWGLLGYLAQDVIGAEQEESFGIRQNHQMYLSDWHRLITKHFAEHRYQPFVPERGWGERIVKRAALNEWRAARLLGGTLAAMCKKAGAQRAAGAPGPFRNPAALPGLPRRPGPRPRRYPGVRLRLPGAQRGRRLQSTPGRLTFRTLSGRPCRRDRFLPPQPHRPPGRRMVRAGRGLRQQIPLDGRASHGRAPPRPRGGRRGCGFVVLRTKPSSPKASR